MSEENFNEDNTENGKALSDQVAPLVMLTCPFCGDLPNICEFDGEFTAHCSNDGCVAGNFAIWRQTENDAIETWNKRLTRIETGVIQFVGIITTP